MEQFLHQVINCRVILPLRRIHTKTIYPGNQASKLHTVCIKLTKFLGL